MSATAELSAVGFISEREFQLLNQWFKHVPDRVYYKDVELNVRWCNRRLLQDLALDSIDDIVGKSSATLSLLPANVAPALRNAERATLAAGQPIISKLTGFNDAREVCTATIVPVCEDDVIIGILGILRFETDYPPRTQLIDNLLNNAPDLIYFKDTDSKFIRCSEYLAAHLGANSAQDVIGKSDFDFFEKQHAQTTYKAEQKIVETGEPLLNIQQKETLSNGEVVWMLTSKMPLYDSFGKIIGTFGISKDISQQKNAECEIADLNERLLVASRQAGMAEVATNVLHNVGNVLNSVGVASSLAVEKIRNFKFEGLKKACDMLTSSAHEPNYLSADSKGRQLPSYLTSLTTQFIKNQDVLLKEMTGLLNHITHINEILRTQQSFAGGTRLCERIHVSELIEDAMRMNEDGLRRHEVALVINIDDNPEIETEKHKVLQILVNLVRNAKNACDEANVGKKSIELRTTSVDGEYVDIQVIDNGIGILAENLPKLFQHGFTTRKEGHGFGLHSAANTATELGGTLVAHSDGANLGATFTLRIPFVPPTKT